MSDQNGLNATDANFTVNALKYLTENKFSNTIKDKAVYRVRNEILTVILTEYRFIQHWYSLGYQYVDETYFIKCKQHNNIASC